MRLGTRASALALAQAAMVAEQLGGEPQVELVTIKTTGDRGEHREDKSRWVKELEAALLGGEIDLAVHSAKDVPTELPAGLALLGVPGRADARDVLCGAAALSELPPQARVGTSSLRRSAQLRAARPDLEVLELRGNVDTRLRKLGEEDYDAIVLALAGLERLGRGGEAGAPVAVDTMTPAAGQGTLVLEGRSGDAEAARAAGAVNDPRAALSLTAERAVVAELEASCHTPLGVLAVPVDGRLVVSSFVGRADGSAWLRDRVAGSAEDPERLGRAAAQRLRAAGADDLLAS